MSFSFTSIMYNIRIMTTITCDCDDMGFPKSKTKTCDDSGCFKEQYFDFFLFPYSGRVPGAWFPFCNDPVVMVWFLGVQPSLRGWLLLIVVWSVQI